MATGIEIDPEVVALFNDIKSKHTYKYAAFKIVNNKIVVDKELFSDPKLTETKEDKEFYDELVTKLKLIEEPRYIVYDLGLKNEEDQLALIFW